MKTNIAFILILTAIIQFIIYNKEIPITLEKPIFLITDSRNNYSEIHPIFPLESFQRNSSIRFSKTTIRLIRAGSIITYVGKTHTHRYTYNVYKFEGKTLLLKSYPPEHIFRSNNDSESLAYSIENNQKLIDQLITNKVIDSEICFQNKYFYNNSVFYLKKMLEEYNLDKDVLLNSTKEVEYGNDKYSCTNAQFKNTKTYFFVSQFISNENIYH